MEAQLERNKENTSQPFLLHFYDDYLSSDKLKKLHSFESEAEKTYYQSMVKTLSDLLDSKNYSKAYDMLLAMQQHIHRPAFLSAIDGELFSSVLCNNLLLPLGSCSEKQYFCERIIYIIAMTINKDEYKRYLQNVKHRFVSDKMFLKQMHQIEKSYEKAVSD